MGNGPLIRPISYYFFYRWISQFWLKGISMIKNIKSWLKGGGGVVCFIADILLLYSQSSVKAFLMY